RANAPTAHAGGGRPRAARTGHGAGQPNGHRGRARRDPRARDRLSAAGAERAGAGPRGQDRSSERRAPQRLHFGGADRSRAPHRRASPRRGPQEGSRAPTRGRPRDRPSGGRALVVPGAPCGRTDRRRCAGGPGARLRPRAAAASAVEPAPERAPRERPGGRRAGDGRTLVVPARAGFSAAALGGHHGGRYRYGNSGDHSRPHLRALLQRVGRRAALARNGPRPVRGPIDRRGAWRHRERGREPRRVRRAIRRPPPHLRSDRRALGSRMKADAVKRPELLVVDDQPAVVEYLCESLAARGYAPVGLASSLEALARIQAEPFDLVITDVEMPELHGVDLLRAVLEAKPNQLVLLITAYGSVEKAVAAVQAGACDFLTKPFKIESLVHSIEPAFSERMLRRDRQSGA